MRNFSWECSTHMSTHLPQKGNPQQMKSMIAQKPNLVGQGVCTGVTNGSVCEELLTGSKITEKPTPAQGQFIKTESLELAEHYGGNLPELGMSVPQLGWSISISSSCLVLL